MHQIFIGFTLCLSAKKFVQHIGDLSPTVCELFLFTISMMIIVEKECGLKSACGFWYNLTLKEGSQNCRLNCDGHYSVPGKLPTNNAGSRRRQWRCLIRQDETLLVDIKIPKTKMKQIYELHLCLIWIQNDEISPCKMRTRENTFVAVFRTIGSSVKARIIQ